MSKPLYHVIYHHTVVWLVFGNTGILLTFCYSDGSTIQPVSLEELSFLSTINEIAGYLVIQNLNSTNFTNLRFLRNLEVLGGDEIVEYRPGQEFSLVIEDNNYLQTLGLSSLREIRNGGVRVSGNPQLCLVDTLNFEDYFVTSTQLVRTGGLGMECTGEM